MTSVRSSGEPDDAERFRLLIESVTDYAIYMLDPEGVVTTWNTGAERLKGYGRSEIIGRHFSTFYTDEDRECGLPARALAMAQQAGRCEHEGWRIRRDGSRMWAHVIIDPIRAPDGTLLGFAKITRDVTERRRAQEQLQLSEQRFRMLVQGIKDYAIYMLDPSGRVTNWNSGAEQMKGYTEEEILGRHVSTFYSEEDRAAGRPARALETAAREGRFTMEGWRIRKDGTRFWADVVVDAIRNEAGELLGFAKITRDVTERRRAQQELEEARAKMVQSQKMEMIGQLTGGIAHDFNNLLAVILGNLDLAVRRTPDDDKLRRLLANSMEAAKRGASLTQRMLAFARRQELKSEPVDVGNLVRNMAELLDRSLGPSIDVETRFPLRMRPVLVDGNQLELALLNLAVNARDAMPEGGTLTIAAAEHRAGGERPSELPPGDYVCVSVQDTGLGMDPDTLSRAVEPFFTTKGIGRGTGLGLSMIHGFADQSAGRLVLKSVPGRGTTAELWLPMAGDAVAQDGPPARDEAAGKTVPRRQSLLVLAVDDDPLVLMNTTAMIEDLGHSVLEATSGTEALALLRRNPNVDVLITDHLMPGMTGAQLVEAVLAEKPHLPVVLATGYAQLPQELPVARLNKPYNQADLAAAIESAAPNPHGERRVVPFRGK